jgi:hypothetical protein
LELISKFKEERAMGAVSWIDLAWLYLEVPVFILKRMVWSVFGLVASVVGEGLAYVVLALAAIALAVVIAIELFSCEGEQSGNRPADSEEEQGEPAYQGRHVRPAVYQDQVVGGERY